MKNFVLFLVDNNTWNNSHIALVGKAMSSNESAAFEIMTELDVDYVLGKGDYFYVMKIVFVEIFKFLVYFMMSSSCYYLRIKTNLIIYYLIFPH